VAGSAYLAQIGLDIGHVIAITPDSESRIIGDKRLGNGLFNRTWLGLYSHSDPCLASARQSFAPGFGQLTYLYMLDYDGRHELLSGDRGIIHQFHEQANPQRSAFRFRQLRTASGAGN